MAHARAAGRPGDAGAGRGCPGHYAFDPTGRQIPLFQARPAAPNDYGESWLPIPVWQLPMPLTTPLWDAIAGASAPAPGPQAYPDPAATLWPGSFAVRAAGTGDPLDPAQVRVWPEVGRFEVLSGPADVEVGYHYGLFSRIGAGPYDRRRLGVPAATDPQPRARVAGGSAISLPDAIAALGPRRHRRGHRRADPAPPRAGGSPAPDRRRHDPRRRRAAGGHPHRARRAAVDLQAGRTRASPVPGCAWRDCCSAAPTSSCAAASTRSSCPAARSTRAPAATSAPRRRSGTAASTAATCPRPPSGSRATCAR